MAGHSKWANIKHKKAKADAKKGKIFSRVAKEIITAVKLGGADRSANPRLRLALQKAKENNVPGDVVERNIKKGLSQDSANYEEVTYELYGHGGVGIIVCCLTDNRNRIASEMRIATNKRGGSIATPGAVLFNFDRKGVIQLKELPKDEETLLDTVSLVGGEDYALEEEECLVTCDPVDLIQVKEGLEQEGYSVKEAFFELFPKAYVSCSPEDSEKNEELLAWLDSIDDVDDIFHNQASE